MTNTANQGVAAIVAPETRDLAQLATLLTDWLVRRLDDAQNLRISNLSYPLGAGMSHETILFDAAWTQRGVARRQGMVVRIKPTSKTVYLDDMFHQQYELMRLMHASNNVRVAKPLWFEEDASLLGAPFFVMNKVSGRVPVSYPPYARQGWLFDATPTQRRRAWQEAVQQLAAIQLVSTDDARFLELPGGPNHFDQEIDRWRRYLDWVDPAHKQTLLQECWSQLMGKKPANRQEGIVWGDSRIGNMMFGADFSVVAVMDWEHPSLGGALHDLGWWLCGDFVQTTAQGLKPLEGMGTREETIALWSQTCGKSAADIDWYFAFAFFKMETTGVRMTVLREMPSPARTPHVPGAMTKRLLADLK